MSWKSGKFVRGGFTLSVQGIVRRWLLGPVLERELLLTPVSRTRNILRVQFLDSDLDLWFKPPLH